MSRFGRAEEVHCERGPASTVKDVDDPDSIIAETERAASTEDLNILGGPPRESAKSRQPASTSFESSSHNEWMLAISSLHRELAPSSLP